MKRFAQVLLISLLLALFGCGGEKKDPTAYASEVKAYCDKIMAYAKEADQAAKAFADISAQMGISTSIYDAYDAASTAMKISDAANHAISNEKIPDVSGELKDLLKKVRADFSTAYYVKSNAFESAMEFLDSKSPAALKEFKDGMKSATGFIYRGAAELTSAKAMAGLTNAK